jgi:hypothetical protein
MLVTRVQIDASLVVGYYEAACVFVPWHSLDVLSTPFRERLFSESQKGSMLVLDWHRLAHMSAHRFRCKYQQCCIHLLSAAHIARCFEDPL